MILAIIHADDYGWSEGVNHGIINAHQCGILTSTSVIATMPGFGDAVRRRDEAPDLGFGAHLSLNLGRPISSPESVPLLVDSHGYLRYSYFYHLRKSGNQHYLDQIRRELTAQLATLRDNGFKLDHANSQSHIHMIPRIHDTFEELLRDSEIKHLRHSVESWRGEPYIRRPANLLKCLTLAFLGGRRPPQTADIVGFIGTRHSADMNTETLATYLQDLRPGTWEIVSHPGTGVLDDDSGYQKSAIRWMRSAGRQREWEALVSDTARAALKQADITTVRFSDLD